jgi:ribosomal protein L7/L12
MTFLWIGVVLVSLVGVAVVARLLLRRRIEVVTLRPQSRMPSVHDTQEIERLVRAGKKIEAIRSWRERHGSGLREAKAAVDRLEPRGNLVPPAMSDEPSRQVTDSDIEVQLRTGNILNAIKLYREKTGVGLREAKDAVDTMRHRMRAS